MNPTETSQKWLPTSKKEMEELGWEAADVILFSGDAYVDHPSFGVAVIGRMLEKYGFKVAIVPQPNWRDDLRDFKKLGKPNLFFGVTAGNMDSMVNHYTANKRLRSDDAYTPGGKAGFRPDYATVVYSKILKELFPETPLVIGGIESSLRRFAHYDYWSDTVKPSILIESNADILLYGMAEKSIVALAKRLQSGEKIEEIRDIPQTAFTINFKEVNHLDLQKSINLSSFDDCKRNKNLYAANFKIIETESNKVEAKQLIQQSGNKAVVVNPHYSHFSQEEIDEPYNLPYTRLPHPRYRNKGDIPAYEMIKFSVNIHRGCFGGCSFCTISAHQGKFIRSRSEKSIIQEIKELKKLPDFKGVLTDLGGPSANMYRMQGIDEEICKKCVKPSCIFPRICRNLDSSHKPLMELYRNVASMEGIKKVFIGSGLRYDIFLNGDSEYGQKYFDMLVKNHVSGRLKIAPEHISDEVLQIMRKPGFELFKKLNEQFILANRKYGLNQQLIPYFISSHPGSTVEEMARLATETRRLNFKLEQVQDFTPTPMTLSTVIFHTGINPYDGKKMYVPKSKEERSLQQKLFFWYKPEYKYEITDSLRRLRLTDYISKLFGNTKLQVLPKNGKKRKK